MLSKTFRFTYVEGAYLTSQGSSKAYFADNLLLGSTLNNFVINALASFDIESQSSAKR